MSVSQTEIGSLGLGSVGFVKTGPYVDKHLLPSSVYRTGHVSHVEIVESGEFSNENWWFLFYLLILGIIIILIVYLLVIRPQNDPKEGESCMQTSNSNHCASGHYCGGDGRCHEGNKGKDSGQSCENSSECNYGDVCENFICGI